MMVHIAITRNKKSAAAISPDKYLLFRESQARQLIPAGIPREGFVFPKWGAGE
jgi:hypothetical protein